MTTETQITVKKAGHKDGARSAWVLTKDEIFYGVPLEEESKYQPGAVYAIEYTTRESKGRTYRDIQSAKLVSNATAASSNGATAGHNGAGTAHNQFRNPEQMFVEAMLAKCLDVYKIPLTEEELTKHAFMLQTVWQRLWGDNG